LVYDYKLGSKTLTRAYARAVCKKEVVDYQSTPFGGEFIVSTLHDKGPLRITLQKSAIFLSLPKSLTEIFRIVDKFSKTKT
jgi:hypothetical protein